MAAQLAGLVERGLLGRNGRPPGTRSPPPGASRRYTALGSAIDGSGSAGIGGSAGEGWVACGDGASSCPLMPCLAAAAPPAVPSAPAASHDALPLAAALQPLTPTEGVKPMGVGTDSLVSSEAAARDDHEGLGALPEQRNALAPGSCGALGGEDVRGSRIGTHPAFLGGGMDREGGAGRGNVELGEGHVRSQPCAFSSACQDYGDSCGGNGGSLRSSAALQGAMHPGSDLCGVAASLPEELQWVAAAVAMEGCLVLPPLQLGGMAGAQAVLLQGQLAPPSPAPVGASPGMPIPVLDAAGSTVAGELQGETLGGEAGIGSAEAWTGPLTAHAATTAERSAADCDVAPAQDASGSCGAQCEMGEGEGGEGGHGSLRLGGGCKGEGSQGATQGVCAGPGRSSGGSGSREGCAASGHDEEEGCVRLEEDAEFEWGPSGIVYSTSQDDGQQVREAAAVSGPVCVCE
jgi:hypothetical protein